MVIYMYVTLGTTEFKYFRDGYCMIMTLYMYMITLYKFIRQVIRVIFLNNNKYNEFVTWNVSSIIRPVSECVCVCVCVCDCIL